MIKRDLNDPLVLLILVCNMQYVVEGGVSFLGTKGKISFACLMHCEGPINRNRRLTMCPLPSVFLWKLVRPVCSGFFTILLEFDKNFFKPRFKGFLFSKLIVIVVKDV